MKVPDLGKRTLKLGLALAPRTPSWPILSYVAWAGLACPAGLGKGTGSLRVMSATPSPGTLQQTDRQNNPTVVFEFGRARRIPWTDL
jgi:hypothetical protein